MNFLVFLVAAAAVAAPVSALNFVAIGDWGGTDSAPYSTAPQRDAAQAMNKVAADLDVKFVMAVGDNFYYDGVVEEGSTRFNATFESVYTGQALQADWFVIAGNHDHNGNVSAQVAYSDHSSRWKFPSTYYARSFKTEDGGSVDIVYIDTVELASAINVAEDHPSYFDPLPLQAKSAAPDQWAWIEQQMQASTADHLIIVGHYPVYSVCKHGPTSTLVEHLRPLLLKYQAHYISGHDHCMEYFREPDANVHYFLTGMGVECCYTATRKSAVPKDVLQWYIAAENRGSATAGFSSFQVTKKSLVSTFYDQHGQQLFTTPSIPARQL